MTNTTAPTPNPDYLDVLAEDAAVAAINNARDAISQLERFDARAHDAKFGVQGSLDHLLDAAASVRAAIDQAREAGRLQAEADKAR